MEGAVIHQAVPEKDPRRHSWDYLELIGVSPLPPRTSVLDPGYCPHTLESHLEQSAHLISIVKISMACWQIANERATRKKIAAARQYNVPVCTGGGPYEIAASFGKLPEFLDVCADMGATRIEAGNGFTDTKQEPRSVVQMARERGLEVQLEIGQKHAGAFNAKVVEDLIIEGHRWLDAGVHQIILEARESANNVGLFDEKGVFNAELAERFIDAFGMDNIVFEAPTKQSQFTLLSRFGAEVHLSNVRLEELLRVEIYRRGLHSDAFSQPKLRPHGPKEAR